MSMSAAMGISKATWDNGLRAALSTLTPTAKDILERRYLLRGPDGQPVEDIDGIFRRVAKHVASAERFDADRILWEERFYEAMISLRFMPNSPTLMNAGTGKGTLSACFVIPINDSLDSILGNAHATGMIQKFGGGTGFSFSRLRSTGHYIASTQGAACGPLSVLDHYNDVSRLVTQGGKREGANMAVLRYNHPDIMAFVHAKHNVSRCQACDGRGGYTADGQLTHTEKADHRFIEDTRWSNFNISVAVDDKFFELVEADGAIDLYDYPGQEGPITPYVQQNLEAKGTLRARELWDAICEEAHYTGDPGLLFMERINNWRANPIAVDRRAGIWWIDATNPCGEKPLFDWDSCNLGHLRLSAYYAPGLNADDFDWKLFESDIYTQTRFLDNVITVNVWPLPENEKIAKQLRRIGNGVMGEADLLMLKGLPYDSDEGLAFSEKIAVFFEEMSWRASRDLVFVEGRDPFTLWKSSIYATSEWAGNEPFPAHWLNVPVRNAIRTTIAPTGTTSVISGCSSCIEPQFQLAFHRQHKTDRGAAGQLQWKRYTEVNPIFRAALEGFGADVEPIAQAIIDGAALGDIVQAPFPTEVFHTAQDISWQWHVRHQAVWQQHIDDGVSKTINMPNSATVEDMRAAYLAAYNSGCLGITCYRDGSRSYQVLGSRTIEEQEADTSNASTSNAPAATIELSAEDEAILHDRLHALGKNPHKRRRLVDDRTGNNHHFDIAGQDGYIWTGEYPDKALGEVFIKIAKNGSTLQGFADICGLLMSLLLQYGVPAEVFCEKMIGTRFEPMGLTKNPRIRNTTSIVDYLARHVMQTYGSNTEPAVPSPTEFLIAAVGEMTMMPSADDPDVYVHEFTLIGKQLTGSTCPDCGQLTAHEAGCESCEACGWSRC